MDKRYWEKFYKTHEITEKPSDFAVECLPLIPKNHTLIDLGCGNGRDTYFFAKNNIHVLAIDYASIIKTNSFIEFWHMPLRDLIRRKWLGKAKSVIYARFFLHSITDMEILRLLEWCEGWFMAEFRCKGDKPVIYKNHKRNYINANLFLDLLHLKGFTVVRFLKGRGLAKYGKEDPLVCRVIAYKRKVK